MIPLDFTNAAGIWRWTSRRSARKNVLIFVVTRWTSPGCNGTTMRSFVSEASRAWNREVESRQGPNLNHLLCVLCCLFSIIRPLQAGKVSTQGNVWERLLLHCTNIRSPTLQHEKRAWNLFGKWIKINPCYAPAMQLDVIRFEKPPQVQHTVVLQWGLSCRGWATTISIPKPSRLDGMLATLRRVSYMGPLYHHNPQ